MINIAIASDIALGILLLGGAGLCLTACTIWRGGYAAGQAEERYETLRMMEEGEEHAREQLERAGQWLERITAKPEVMYVAMIPPAFTPEGMEELRAMRTTLQQAREEPAAQAPHPAFPPGGRAFRGPDRDAALHPALTGQ